MKNWAIRNKKVDLKKLSEELNEDKLICKILSNRGIVSASEGKKYFNYSTNTDNEFLLLKDILEGTELILKGLEDNKKIRIIGDYDQDGISSTVILLKGLKSISCNVDYDIPNRVTDGYGISDNLVEKAHDDGIDIIITCDNGIAAIESVKKAVDLGMDIIVTDHHDIKIDGKSDKEILPIANAIINPKRKDCNYPYKNICGAMVAFLFMQGIYFKLDRDIEELDYLLEFVAMATVCDVVDLIGKNRDLVKIGLKKMNTTLNLGLKELININNIKNEVNSYHIGFIIGPCINASGRLDTAKIAVELFTTENIDIANKKAKQLYELNKERKEITRKGAKTIMEKIEKDYTDDKIIVVFEESLYESVAGIVAGRVKEKYNRPTIIITKSNEEGIVKASCRSIEKYNIFLELSKTEDLFLKFGGHEMAAGFSMKSENISILREKLNNDIKLSKEELVPTIYIDTQLPISKVNWDLAESLQRFEPFGKGNSKPKFGAKSLKIKKLQVLGSSFKVVKVYFEEKFDLPGIIFTGDDTLEKYIIEKYNEEEYLKVLKGVESNICLDIIYTIDTNEYNGKSSLQMIIKDYR